MGSEVSVHGNVTALARRLFSDGDAQIEYTPMGAMLVASPMGTASGEIARMGDSWQVAVSTGLTALTALPTTTNGLGLWNGEGPNGKTYMIDGFGFWTAVADVTNALDQGLFALVNVAPVAAPTDAALTIRSTVGKKYGGKARTTTNAAVTNDGWFPVGTSTNAAVAAAAGDIWKVQEALTPPGLFQIPPGGMFNIASVAVTGGAAGTFYFIRWHEVRHGGIVS